MYDSVFSKVLGQPIRGGRLVDPKKPDADKFEDVRPDDQRGLAEDDRDTPAIEVNDDEAGEDD